MEWTPLNDASQINSIVKASYDQPQLIFKHSTSCSISSMAKLRLEDDWDLDGVDAHYLDLLAYRPLSTAVAEQLEVHHESPQVILLIGGDVVYDASHLDITVDELREALDYARARG